MAENTSHEFRAETRKVLNILTNSLYTNREIFLRELISNASDALDKLRFSQSRGDTPCSPELPLEIKITLDKDAKTLTITDTGIGMSRKEMIDNLGTIARSGSEQFLADLEKEKAGAAKAGDSTAEQDKENAKAGDAENAETAGEKKDAGASDAAQIIGRFGIGFYSVFMVADNVSVTSRPAFGKTAATWTSDGLGTYTIKDAGEGAPERGTKIVAHLKDDASEYLEKFRIENVIKKHSGFIPFPVLLEGETVNTQPALWREPKFSITKEQYAEFYKALTYDHKDPQDQIHLSVDAPVQFNALLFIPDTETDLYGMGRDHWGPDLYARRVLINHENKDLLPDYLAFLKGVVDTEDLPLNISRETLQENLVIRKIQQTLVRQVLAHLEKLAKTDTDAYNKFWRRHGRVFKLGYNDYANKDRIAALLRFNSSEHTDKEGLTSLDEYMTRAREGQKTIWFVCAPNREAARLNPHTEIFRRKGLEVLFLCEPVDEFVMDSIGKYKDWDLKSVEAATDDQLKDFSDKEDNKPKEAPLSEDDNAAFDKLLARVKEILGGKVKDVRLSHRLADSPACLVSDDGVSSSMEKFMRVMQKNDSLPVKILEVNRDHPFFRALLRIFKADPNDHILEEMIWSVFDTSLLLDGYLKDPQILASRTNALLAQAGAWYAEVKHIQ